MTEGKFTEWNHLSNFINLAINPANQINDVENLKIFGTE